MAGRLRQELAEREDPTRQPIEGSHEATRPDTSGPPEHVENRAGLKPGPVGGRPRAGDPWEMLPLAVALSWTVGAVPGLARIAGHSSNGAAAAAVLAVFTLGLAVVVSSAPLKSAWVIYSGATIAVAAELLTVGLVGRAPALVASTGTVVAALALGAARLDRRPPALTWIGVVLAAGASAGWAATGSWLWLTGFAASAAASLLTQRWRSEDDSRTAPPTPRSLGCWLAERRDLMLAGLAAGVVAWPMFHRLATGTAFVRGVNDFPAHYDRVVPLSWSPFFLSAPHPLFHISVRWLEIITGPIVAMTGVMAAALAALVVLLVLIGRSGRFAWKPLTFPWALGFAFIMMLGASPALLFEVGGSLWNRPEGFDISGAGPGYFPLHVWGSPTLTMAMTMYVALVPLTLRLLDDPHSRRRKVQVLLLTLLATLTSPSGILGLAPALAAVVLLRRRSGGSNSLATEARAAGWLIVPAAIVVAWQMWFLATSQSPLEETTWQFNPFWIVEQTGMTRPIFWAIWLVPVTSASAVGRKYFADPAIRWCALGLFISFFPTFLLQETGWKATHAGLAMTTFVCSTLLIVFSVRLLFEKLHDSWVRRDVQPLGIARGIAAIVLMAVVAAGAVDYLTAVGLVDRI